MPVDARGYPTPLVVGDDHLAEVFEGMLLINKFVTNLQLYHSIGFGLYRYANRLYCNSDDDPNTNLVQHLAMAVVPAFKAWTSGLRFMYNGLDEFRAISKDEGNAECLIEENALGNLARVMRFFTWKISVDLRLDMQQVDSGESSDRLVVNRYNVEITVDSDAGPMRVLIMGKDILVMSKKERTRHFARLCLRACFLKVHLARRAVKAFTLASAKRKRGV